MNIFQYEQGILLTQSKTDTVPFLLPSRTRRLHEHIARGRRAKEVWIGLARKLPRDRGQGIQINIVGVVNVRRTAGRAMNGIKSWLHRSYSAWYPTESSWTLKSRMIGTLRVSNSEAR
jgi:hypothetical protein